jgi:hypothetical protein
MTTLNMSGEQHCRWCADDGWVVLKEAGMAPCKWCETGRGGGLDAELRQPVELHR